VHIREAFQKAKKEFGGHGLLPSDMDHMAEILRKAIAALPRLFICIDALDESTANTDGSSLRHYEKSFGYHQTREYSLLGGPIPTRKS